MGGNPTVKKSGGLLNIGTATGEVEPASVYSKPLPDGFSSCVLLRRLFKEHPGALQT